VAKILIIEDNKDLAEIYKNELVFNGFEVYIVEMAIEIYAALDSLKPDLILLDIMLSDGYGLDILKKIKGNDAYNKIIVIVLSNIDAPTVINEAYANNVDGYIIKSMILPSQLTDEVKLFLK